MLTAPAGAEQQVLTYDSPEVGCDWLDAEYVSATRIPDEDQPSVTREGLLMTGGMILTLPLQVFGSLFGSESQPKYDFSRDVNDIKNAAEKKNCHELLKQIESDNQQIENDNQQIENNQNENNDADVSSDSDTNALHNYQHQ